MATYSLIGGAANRSRIHPDQVAFMHPASSHATWLAPRSRTPVASCPPHGEVPRRAVGAGGRGNKTTYAYTALGSLETVTSPPGKVTTYGYDTAGNRTSVTTPLGEKTTFTYDKAGHVLTRTDPRGNPSGADPAAYTTKYTHDGRGLLSSATDARSIARFRRRHLNAPAGLFTQSLHLVTKLGMVKMGRVALDGTELEANASQHKAMSYGRLIDKEERIEAEAADKARRHAEGKERRRQQRKGTADEQAVTDAGEAAAKARPKPRARANFTDPDSRLSRRPPGPRTPALCRG